ncbi:HK97 family phage prohead protease [Rathayibacter sp. AY1E1]|uniref:HK97 family phage prohead protease n=1 Tax=Rathayibacter sp. AY1E1 TaxID=2080549 RepID=UPI000CE88F0C|nr:HK97 family phage prohead protease [Rathayibacter sp. AY1E1]PPH51204.1 HK97 family phage prohead protease [Rathayibacter sp. AY1E1]
MLTKNSTVQVKAVGPDDELGEGVFEAIVSVFGNVDSYGDRVLKGAFADTLAEWEASGNPIPVYWSHRMDDPDYNIGHVLEAKETDDGLWVKAQLDLEGPKALQVYRLLKGRRVAQFSFAYDVLDYAIVKSEDEPDSVWELRKLKLYEVGPTPIGANQETELLAVKAGGRSAARLAAEVKAGRVISAKNEGELRTAYDSIGRVLSALDIEDEGKASGSHEVKDDEPATVKSDEPTGEPPALTRLQIELADREFATL